MELLTYLRGHKDQIIHDANESLSRMSLKHYSAAGSEENRERLQRLFTLTLESIEEKDLLPVMNYSRKIAAERFQAGFGLYEVQNAYNILEGILWQRILTALQPDEIAEALGLVSTVLGSGKDALACAYVSLATETKTPTLDMSALFKGTDGV